MPRIDPRTGVPVMTMQEFWESEVKHEDKGRTGSEIAMEFFVQMDAEERKEEERMRQPEVALQMMLEEIASYEEEDRPVAPVSIVGVLETEFHHSLSGESTTKIRAVATKPDGTEGVINYAMEAFSGDWDEPPYGSSEIWWDDEKTSGL